MACFFFQWRLKEYSILNNLHIIIHDVNRFLGKIKNVYELGIV